MTLKFIKLTRSFVNPKGAVLSLGGFDGIHLGHQALLKKLIESSKKRKTSSCLCLFDPLPFQVLNGEKNFKRLFTIQELKALLRSFDLDFLCIASFNKDFSKLSPKKFIQSFLVSHFSPVHIIAGYDFSFSYKKKGNFFNLQSYGKEFGFSVERIQPYLYKKKPVSSSRIRKHLYLADMREVKALLGRAFFIQSQVVKGDGRGRKLGFPTANLQPEQKELPPFGVYAGSVQIRKKNFSAVINIGCRPSFEGSQIFVEAHIPFLSRNLYGQTLKVELWHFIRKERKFSHVSDLKRQIRQDIQTVLN